MVKVELYRRSSTGDLVGFEASGHSGYADKGEDIVCSAVSALTQVTVLGLTQRLKVMPQVEVDGERGYLLCRLSPEDHTEAVWLRVQDLLETLALGLHEIAREHGEYVKVEEVAE